MYPFHFRHLAHTFHQLFGYHMQRIEIIAIKAVFQFVDLQEIQSFEFHVGIGERLAQLGLILCQQIYSCLITLGIDDKLGIVVACYLGRVCIHETR